MCLELQVLCDRYKELKENNPNLYIYDEVETIEYENIHNNGLSLSVKMIKVKESYKLFFFVSKIDKLILMYLIEESENDLSTKFNSIFSDLCSMSIDMFINKYCKV